MSGSHISLFSGVGMTDLAIESLGWTTIATAEINPWCRELLCKRFPAAWHFSDVATVERGIAPWDTVIQRPLLISGGFPCQGISAIGGRAGLSDQRSSLWSEFARVIHEFRPDAVLVENSPMLRSRGLDRVLCDLSDLGYDARWDCIPAASVGAPHLRDRIFIAAWPNGDADIAYTDLERPYLGVAVTAGIVGIDWLEGDSVGVADTGTGKYITRLPRAGELIAGFVSERTPAAPTRGLRGAVRFPTPRRASNEWRTTRNAPTHGTSHGKTLAGELNDLERAAGRVLAQSSESAGNINPAWVEWLMGLPMGWTDPCIANSALVPFPGWAAEPPGVPRTAYPVAHRKERLMALGNGLVPPAVRAAMKILYRPGGAPS